jgi:hypothetical protein
MRLALGVLYRVRDAGLQIMQKPRVKGEALF